MSSVRPPPCVRSSDLLDAHGPVFVARTIRGQRDRECKPRVGDRAGALAMVANRFEELLELDAIGRLKSLQEIAVSGGAWRLHTRFDRSQGGAVVPTHRHAVLEAEDLHPYVVAAGIIARGGDGAQHAALKPEYGTCGADVAMPCEHLAVGLAVVVHLARPPALHPPPEVVVRAW